MASFNLLFRLGHEYVVEWDESLYGVTAWEALTHGSWIGTTLFGQLDYYNTKPPLLIWLIALSFKVLGPSLWSLRLVSAISAWTTVLVVLRWTRKHFGRLPALVAGSSLSTLFGFIYVHSGRSAATDALFTLLTTAGVMIAWAARTSPSLRIWLGPILAGAFLLRGTAVLLPLALVLAISAVGRPRPRRSLAPTLTAVALFAAPVGAWLAARHQIDGWRFVRPMIMYDFVQRLLSPIEGHPGQPFYYLKVLEEHHYDWLFAGFAAIALLPQPRQLLRAAWARYRRPQDPAAALAIWAGLTFAIPVLIRTKLPWYLNTFYPPLAIGLALVCSTAIETAARPGAARWRRMAIAGALVMAAAAAEGRLIWYSYAHRDLRLSSQALLLAESANLRGHRLWLDGSSRATHFVAEAIVGARVVRAPDDQAAGRAAEGDFLLTLHESDLPAATLVRTDGTAFLYRLDASPSPQVE